MVMTVGSIAKWEVKLGSLCMYIYFNMSLSLTFNNTDGNQCLVLIFLNDLVACSDICNL